MGRILAIDFGKKRTGLAEYGSETLIELHQRHRRKSLAKRVHKRTDIEGCGLAAPQIGKSIRLFIVDGSDLAEDFPECAGLKKTFVNPEIIEESEEKVSYPEGCLSLPGISENVVRPRTITIRYQDEDFNEHTETYTDFAARIILHEYDHLEAHVFTDRISPIRKQFVKGKLTNIAKGKTSARYRTKH